MTIDIDNLKQYDIDELHEIKEKLMRELREDPSTINKLAIDNEKRKLLERETTGFDRDNIAGFIRDIAMSIPSDATPLEKVRWVYIKLGKLFSYDYRVVDDMSYATKFFDVNSIVDRYETCVQISGIMNWVLNQIDGVKSKTLPRRTDSIRGLYGEDHFANEVTVDLKDGFTETYLLDLTLDLYLIQGGYRTQHFGFEGGQMSEYDIIPHVITKQIDEKYGLYENGYRDELLDKVKEKIETTDYSGMTDAERIDEKLRLLATTVPKIRGYHEELQLVRKLFRTSLHENYKEFTLYYKNGENTNMKTCYKIETDDYSLTIVLTSEMGFIPIGNELIDAMIGDDWRTRSISLQ